MKAALAKAEKQFQHTAARRRLAVSHRLLTLS
nr:MAG TPA: hypothetical protein [Herelleviridae sp.]